VERKAEKGALDAAQQHSAVRRAREFRALQMPFRARGWLWTLGGTTMSRLLIIAGLFLWSATCFAQARLVQCEGHTVIKVDDRIGAMSRSVLNEARQRLRICMLRDLAFAVH
jgi:hypothetical protein